MYNPLNSLDDAKKLIDSVTGKDKISEAADILGDVIYVIIDFFVQLVKNPLEVIVPVIHASRPYLVVALVVFLVLRAIDFDSQNKNKYNGKVRILLILIVLFSLFI